jgi:hypothetical protein
MRDRSIRWEEGEGREGEGREGGHRADRNWQEAAHPPHPTLKNIRLKQFGGRVMLGEVTISGPGLVH